MAVTEDKPAEQNGTPERDPLLEISTIAPTRDTVDIDGKAYEMRLLSDFGIADQQALVRDSSEYNRLWTQEEPLTEHEGAKLKLLLDRIFDKVLVAPKTVRAKVKDIERSRIATLFTIAPLVRAEQAVQTQTQETQQAQDSSTTAN